MQLKCYNKLIVSEFGCLLNRSNQSDFCCCRQSCWYRRRSLVPRHRALDCCYTWPRSDFLDPRKASTLDTRIRTLVCIDSYRSHCNDSGALRE